MQGAKNMTIKQITIEIPNQPGQMAKVSDLMGEAGVNILALFHLHQDPRGQRLDPLYPR
jgi:ACT domain-containing protein